MSNLNRYLYVVFPNVKFQTHQAIHILCTSTLQSGWFHYRHKEAITVLIKAVHRKNLVDKKHIKLIKHHQMYLPRSKPGNYIRYCHLYPIQGTLRIWLIISLSLRMDDHECNLSHLSSYLSFDQQKKNMRKNGPVEQATHQWSVPPGVVEPSKVIVPKDEAHLATSTTWRQGSPTS